MKPGTSCGRRDLTGSPIDAGAPLRAFQSLESAEREDRLAAWLGGHGFDVDLAYPLAEHGLTAAALDDAAPAFDADTLAPVPRYLAADCEVRGLLADISSSTERIHSLVAAVKKHTHMDRAAVVEPIRLEEHLTDTVTLMSGKAVSQAQARERNSLGVIVLPRCDRKTCETG